MPSPYTYYSYDLLTGTFIGSVPLNDVSFGQVLNGAGQLTATVKLDDPRVQATLPLQQTVPNRTFIVVDYRGAALWGGMVMTRKRSISASGQNTSRTLEIQCSELWAYFGQRIQATDYSAPPTSGIEGTMTYWKAIPWDASLIGCQVLADAIGYQDSKVSPYGNPLSMSILLNGKAPSGSEPVTPVGDYIAVTYPFISLQTVETIVQQLTQLGYTVGFDVGIDIAYSAGTASKPTATINVSYPRRGRKASENALSVDLSQARQYEFPEDGSQTANTVYEIGGSSAIEVSANVVPLEQGYPIWERSLSRSNAQSQNVIELLKQTGASDLALYTYAVVAPTLTIPAEYGPMPLGSFIVGEDFTLKLPALNNDGSIFDARFPAGLEQPWRITGWTAKIPDEGESTVQLNLAQPPQSLAEILGPGI